MELYIKNKKGQLEETALINVLEKALLKAGFKLDIGGFNGENTSWIGIIQETNKPSQILTNIIFDGIGNTITEVKVFEIPIKTIIDNDNMKQII